MAQRVAVIGAGTAGLTSIKCCLDEGLVPVCFEKNNDIGGLWKFKEDLEDGQASLYHTLVANISKEMMCYSDFPMPADYPNFMHHSLVQNYLYLYAEHFDLLKYIHLQTTVVSVTQRPDYSHTGQWEVITRNRDGQQETQVFDGVLVCTGSCTHPIKPLSAFAGLDTFPGSCIHSWEYKDPYVYRGKKVLVIGSGQSAGDLASELSRVASKTILSMQKGSWIVGRMSTGGLPLDMNLLTRLNFLLLRILPLSLLNWIIERIYNQKYNHKLYGLQPSFRLLQQLPMINDELPVRILQGLVQLKPNVREFKGSTVVFENGAVEDGVDAVFLCTGFKAIFPFLPFAEKNDPEKVMSLYKRVFPLFLEHPTLAFIGLLHPSGPLMPIMELQARWATRVFKGSTKLPPAPVMHKFSKNIYQKNMKRYHCPRKATLDADYVPYVDSVAQEIGVRPNLFWLFLTDPRLAWRVLYGPCTPYQFRLFGPGRWDGARQAIFTQWERVAQPFKTRIVPDRKTKKIYYWLSLGGAAILIFAFIESQKKDLSAHFLNSLRSREFYFAPY